MKARGKKFYDELSNKIYNKMITKWPEMDYTKAGSREKGNFKRTSDQDVRFWIENDPAKKNFYPKLKAYLEKELKDYNGEHIRYEIGREGNVLKALPQNGGKFDLVLLSKSEYERQEKKL